MFDEMIFAMDSTQGPVQPVRSGCATAPRTDAGAGEVTTALGALVSSQADIERRVVSVLAQAHASGATIDTVGMPTEMWLRTHTSMTGQQARMAVTLVERLPLLPRLAAALAAAWVTVPVAGQLASWAMDLHADVRDGFLARALERASAEDGETSEDLLRRAEWAWLQALPQDDLERRERRAYASRWFALQPTLDGGMAVHGWFDAESSAPIAAAVDAATTLATRDDPDPATPAQARADGLRTVCEVFLGGTASDEGARRAARPRVTATLSFEALLEARAVARLDRATAAPPDGGSPALGPRAVDRLLCDALLTRIIVHDRGTPVDVAALGDSLPAAYRTAVLDRDGGCRFPGCRAPAAWSDVHHVVWRSRGGATAVDNLVTLCRRHHTTVHADERWKLRLDADGTLDVRRGRRRWTTAPPPRGSPRA